MFQNIYELESSLKTYLDSQRFYSRQSWVPPRKRPEGEKIYDVIIVGAGQSGLSLAYSLKLKGIKRVLILDKQDEYKPGPWSSFAKMKRLRTPKIVPGMEMSNPLLSFETWFCSKYGQDRYQAFDFIPVNLWSEYQSWYRDILDIQVLNNRELEGFHWLPNEDCFSLNTSGREGRKSFYCQKLCLATGMTAWGDWHLPAEYAGKLPNSAYDCAWKEIDFSTYNNQSVAVVGAGASAFDCASRLLENGATSATILSRRKLPKKDFYFDLWRGRNDSDFFPEEIDCLPADLLGPFLAYNSRLGDDQRIDCVSAVFKKGKAPATEEYRGRVEFINEINIFEEAIISDIEFIENNKQAQLTINSKDYYFDKVIFATGVKTNLSLRPELSSLKNEVLLWGHATDRDMPDALKYSPKLTSSFQLININSEKSYLSNIYSLADVIHITVGIHSICPVINSISESIASELFSDHQEDWLNFLNGLDS